MRPICTKRVRHLPVLAYPGSPLAHGTTFTKVIEGGQAEVFCTHRLSPLASRPLALSPTTDIKPNNPQDEIPLVWHSLRFVAP